MNPEPAPTAACYSGLCTHRGGCSLVASEARSEIASQDAEIARLRAAVNHAIVFIEVMQGGSYHVAADAAMNAVREALGEHE